MQISAANCNRINPLINPILPTSQHLSRILPATTTTTTTTQLHMSAFYTTDANDTIHSPATF